ncbi:MAG: hypothetical protein FWG70_06745 [Oscillospiraceae bacterium]|nr:hypothetical protein [Oscillospiraceae bacterium]
MFKMKIEFDESKIKREGKYDIIKMWANIDEYMLKKFKLKRTDDGVYYDYPGYDGYSAFLSFGNRFEDYSWFTENLKKWEFHELGEDKGNEPYIEDWKRDVIQGESA